MSFQTSKSQIPTTAILFNPHLAHNKYANTVKQCSLKNLFFHFFTIFDKKQLMPSIQPTCVNDFLLGLPLVSLPLH